MGSYLAAKVSTKLFESVNNFNEKLEGQRATARRKPQSSARNDDAGPGGSRHETENGQEEDTTTAADSETFLVSRSCSEPSDQQCISVEDGTKFGGAGVQMRSCAMGKRPKSPAKSKPEAA